LAMLHCTRKDWWRDFDDHRDSHMLQKLATLQAARTARTTWVKVKAHASVPLNERADELAALAGEDAQGTRNLPDMELHQIDQWRISYTTAPHHQDDDDQQTEPSTLSPTQLTALLIGVRNKLANPTATKTEGYMRAENVGRSLYADSLWAKGPHQFTDTTVKRNLQILSNTYPTQARLRVIGLADTDICPYCSLNKTETQQHWQCECPCFHDIRKLVHNTIWTAMWQELTSQLTNTPSVGLPCKRQQ